MFAKIMIYLFLIIVLYCLGSALYYMLSRRKTSESMAKALTWRIVVSISLFLLLMVGFLMGWIQPHGVSY